ncbi:MAG: hypothetical protein AB9834_21815 [Lentimicrobium sp.]
MLTVLSEDTLLYNADRFYKMARLINKQEDIMNIYYITDTKGHKSAVQLPLKDWEQIQKDLSELERLRNKKLFLTELTEAVEEMRQIREGKKQTRNAEDFLDEL